MEDKGKTVAIIAYITFIGWIIAIILHQNESNKSELGAFHLRQMLGIVLLGVILGIIPLVNLVAWVFTLILWILGLVSAVQAQQKPVPLVGNFFQNIFAGLK